MTTTDIVNILSRQGNYKTDKRIYKNILFYYGSIMLNKFNFRKTNGNNINYFGITLAMSASGKSFAKDLVANIMKLEDNGNYPKMMSSVAGATKALHQIDIPKNTTVSLSGTKEGLFSVSNGQAHSGYGSLNLLADEMGEIISSSFELIEKVKELYDGYYRAKVIKGDKETIAEENIENIICNFFMFGSPSGLNSKTKEQLIRLCNSGLYRRSFILNIEPKETEQNLEKDYSLKDLVEYFDFLNDNFKGMYLANKEEQGYLFNDNMKISKCGSKELDDVRDYLFELSNSNIYNELISAEKGSYNSIENLSYIIAYLDCRLEVIGSDVVEALVWFKECRKSISDSLTHKRPYKTMYDLLMRGKALALTEMAEMDIDIPTSQIKVKDEIALLDEMCYRKNLKLNVADGRVTRYSIEKLPLNDLKKIKISIEMDKKHERSIDFKPVEIPFFGETSSIEKVIASKKIQSFTTCYFENSNRAEHGHRRADSFISGQNLVAFDIDEGLDLKDCIELLRDYTYIIYTTKSHKKDKGTNGIADRYRVLLPTLSEFYVDAEQHKKLYENLANRLGIVVYDVATRNVSRLWFTNSEAEIFKNQAELLDINCCLPSTEQSEEVMPMINSVNEYLEDNELDRRVEGIYRWFSSKVYSLGRNNTLFRVGKMIKELNLDYEQHIKVMYGMVEPFETKTEIEVIIKSVGSK